MMDSPIKRGQLWFVSLDPTIGSEIKKTRPCLIISNDINNHYANTVTVLPISDRGDKIYPVEHYLPAGEAGLTKDSKVRCQQIRTIDKGRLVKLLGEIKQGDLQSIEQALLIHLGIDII